MDKIFGDGIKKFVLMGIGAAAMTVEKSQQMVDELVKKGELTVEQGKAANEELKHKATEATSGASDAVLRARLKNMSAEERAAWIKNAQKIADDLDAEPVEVEVEEPAQDAE